MICKLIEGEQLNWEPIIITITFESPQEILDLENTIGDTEHSEELYDLLGALLKS